MRGGGVGRRSETEAAGKTSYIFFSFVLTHTHARTQTQDARNGDRSSSPDGSSESSKMHGK